MDSGTTLRNEPARRVDLDRALEAAIVDGIDRARAGAEQHRPAPTSMIFGPDAEQHLAAGGRLTSPNSPIGSALLGALDHDMRHPSIAASKKAMDGLPISLPTKTFAGSAIDLLDGAGLLDDAAVDDADAVGNGDGAVIVVRGVEHGRPMLAVDLAQLRAQAFAQFQVERRERLVEQEHDRPAHQGAGNGDALLFAARKGADVAVEQMRNAQQFGRAADAQARSPSRPRETPESAAQRRCCP